MTRQERAEHTRQGKALDTKARMIALRLAEATRADGTANLKTLDGLGKQAREYHEAYETWWLKK